MPNSGNTRRTRRLAILHVDPERAWGGGEVQVFGLTSRLAEADHRSVVAADPRGVLSVRLKEAGLLQTALPIRNDLDVVAGLRLRRLVRAGAFDLVHFHTARAHALSPWLHGLRVKRVVTRRMDYPLRPGPVTRFLYQRCVDKVVAISTGVHSALQHGGIPDSHLRLIYSGIDTARFARSDATRFSLRSHYGIDPHAPLIVAIGALVPRKDHEQLLVAARQLKSQGYTARYLIAGEGPLRPALAANVLALGLQDEVQLVGFLPDISGLLSAADFFVHTPLYEGLGIAVLEALAAGLPTVASHVGGIPELIAHEETGLLVSPHDAPALAAAVARLLTQPAFARQLGLAGKAFVHDHFDITIMAKRNEALYQELLQGPLSPPSSV